MNELHDSDRSSGYRSSSIPSVHSEENLYENNGVLVSRSLEELSLHSSQDLTYYFLFVTSLLFQPVPLP